jgi:class 3 adenylate cyclase
VSVATRLAIALLIVSIVPLLVSAIGAARNAGSAADEVIRSRLSTVSDSAARELGGYVDNVFEAASILGASRTSIEGVQAFADAYGELGSLPEETIEEQRLSLNTFYADEWIPAIEAVRGEALDAAGFRGIDPGSVYLQDLYIARNPFDLGSKASLVDALDGSTWTETHRSFHPELRSAVSEYGFSDLYLVEPDDLTVVYSAGKDVSFATSLATGPFSGTSLARAVRRAFDSGRPELQSVDFSAFEPAFDEPVAFIAIPLFDEGQVVGALAVGLTSEGISQLMTRVWREGRFGETGEVYIVGADRTMRSNSRLLLESPASYFSQVEATGGTDEVDLNRMRALETSVLFQEVDSPAIRSALAGEEGVVDGSNYLDQEVVTSYRQLPDAFGWVIVSEEEREEFEQPISDFNREATVLAAVFIVLLTFVAVAWSNWFVTPLRAISAGLERVSDGSPFAAIPRRGAREFRALAASIDDMVVVLARRTGAATRAVAHKVELLRVLLPPAAVARINEGSRNLVETSRQATVAAITFPGMNAISADVSTERRREIINAIIDEADALAELNGLQRVKVGADRYYAVCGTETPYLDHAERALTFCLQLREEMREYAQEEHLELAMKAGVDSGSVTVGLVGDSRLVYDLWGEAVDVASRLVQAADDWDVLIAAATAERTSAGAAPVSVDGLEQDAFRVDLARVPGTTS